MILLKTRKTQAILFCICLFASGPSFADSTFLESCLLGFAIIGMDVPETRVALHLIRQNSSAIEDPAQMSALYATPQGRAALTAIQAATEIKQAVEDLNAANELGDKTLVAEQTDHVRLKANDATKRIRAQVVPSLDPHLGKDVQLRISVQGKGQTVHDFVKTLSEMYQNLSATQPGIELREVEVGSDGGLGAKTVTLKFTGPDAWRILRHEAGKHEREGKNTEGNSDKTFRVSALVEVIPVESRSTGSDFDENLIQMQTSRAGGPGGQKVNKTESRVQASYPLPDGTKLSVDIQTERTQSDNKRVAIATLKTQYEKWLLQREAESRDSYRLASVGNGRREELPTIRRYYFEANRGPGNRVRDMRTQGDVPLNQVLSGDFEGLTFELDRILEQQQLEDLAHALSP